MIRISSLRVFLPRLLPRLIIRTPLGGNSEYLSWVTGQHRVQVFANSFLSLLLCDSMVHE